MTRPLRPVYLALPSYRTDDSAVLCSGFVDELARRPQVDEDVLLGIVEFATFVNELAPLGGSLEQCAGAQVSGFRGVDYAGCSTVWRCCSTTTRTGCRRAQSASVTL